MCDTTLVFHLCKRHSLIYNEDSSWILLSTCFWGYVWGGGISGGVVQGGVFVLITKQVQSYTPPNLNFCLVNCIVKCCKLFGLDNDALSPLLDTQSERERALIGCIDKERWQAASSDSGGLEGGKSGYNLQLQILESLRRLNMSTLKFYYDCSSFCHYPGQWEHQAMAEQLLLQF